jgi:hypothetical protein
MTRRIWLAGTVTVLALVVPLVGADTKDTAPAVTAIQWEKIVVEKKFRSEGVAVADVNKDGKPDLLVGDYWYEAPSWKMHEIRAHGDYGDGLRSYSECMVCFTTDVNGDGWPDQMTIGFPGKPCYWYENPKGKSGHWKEHITWFSGCNETPLYVDLFGTGKKVLVMGAQPLRKLVPGPNRQVAIQTTDNEGQMAWFRPGKDPTALWEMHPISEPSQPGQPVPGTFRFSHGLGVGDVNGDGRFDVICTGGWWEQPESAAEGAMSYKPWKFHPATLGEACADMIVYDIDGDGKADIISSSAHKFGIWSFLQRPGKDHPSFLKNDLFPKLVSETHALKCVDINRDGLKDLVTGKRFWSHGKAEPGADQPAHLFWFEAKKSGDGTIRFIPHEIDNDSGIGTQFEVVDFNADGKLDIVTSSKKGTYIHLQK